MIVTTPVSGLIVTPSSGAPLVNDHLFPVLVAVTVITGSFGCVYLKLNVLTFSSLTGVTVTSPLSLGVIVGAVGLTWNVTGLSTVAGA